MAYAVRHKDEGSPVARTRSLVAQLRAVEGISQRELARRAGKCRATICNVEAGSHEPHISTAVAIAKVLGYPVEHVFPDLFGGDDV